MTGHSSTDTRRVEFIEALDEHHMAVMAGNVRRIMLARENLVRLFNDAATAVQGGEWVTKLQQRCVDWGAYWRAPDAHGVNLSVEQATELLRDVLGVEVEIAAAPPAARQEDRDAAKWRWLKTNADTVHMREPIWFESHGQRINVSMIGWTELDQAADAAMSGEA